MGSENDRAPLNAPARLLAVALVSFWMLAVTVPSVSRLWHPLGTFGYRADSDGRVTQVSAASPAQKAGLVTGDRFDVTSIPADERRYALGPLFLAPSAGYSIRLPVIEGSTTRTIAMPAVPERLSLADKLLLIVRTLGAVVFVLVGASLVLLRPSAMTWGLFFFTIGLNPGSDATFDAAIPAAWYPANWTLEALAIAAGNVGFLAFALRFPREEVAGWRRRLSGLTAWFFVIVCALGTYSVLAPYVLGQQTELASRIFYAAGSLGFVAGLVALAATYFHAAGEDRQRIKWVLFGSAIGLPAFAMAGIFELTSVFPAPPYWVIGLLLSLNLMVPAALAYAVIKHRVIDVSFVISRAVVYAILTSLLVAAFAFVDWLLGRQLSNSGLAVIAEVGISIAFAFWLNGIHHRVDRFVDSTLFRRRHLAERRLERVAHALPHARTDELVSELLVREPAEALGLASAALFRRSKDEERFVREACVGWQEHCAESIDAADTLAVHLEAEQQPIGIHDVRWDRRDVPAGAARPQLAVPIVVRRQLLGFVVYGGHSNGVALDPDEIRMIGNLMTGASAAYDHLSAEALRQESLALRHETSNLARRVLELEKELESARADMPESARQSQ